MSYDLVVKRPNYLWIVRDFHSFVQIEITNNKSHNIIGQNWGFNPTQKNDCQKYIDAYKNCLEVEANKHIDPQILKKREELKRAALIKPREAPPQ
jgi:hypothetical protein